MSTDPSQYLTPSPNHRNAIFIPFLTKFDKTFNSIFKYQQQIHLNVYQTLLGLPYDCIVKEKEQLTTTKFGLLTQTFLLD